MISRVSHQPDWLTVEFGTGQTSRYPALWLRDNVPSGRHRTGGQRTFDINSLDRDISIGGATLEGGAIRVEFSEGTIDCFPEEFLAAHPLDGPGTPPNPSPLLWGSEQQSVVSFADYPTLTRNKSARLEWLRQLRDYGYALVHSAPAREGVVLDVVELFGHVRETNYGRLFDVRVEPDPANLANTSAEIGMHTDNPYRDPVPGLQLLHCIVNESDGGASRLCDGFAVAENLRSQEPGCFELLAGQSVHFRYLEAGSADLQHHGPMVDLDVTGNVVGIRYNTRSVSAFDMTADLLPGYYRAYRLFAEMLHDPAHQIEFRLEPGQVMVFDNQRVLHGRSAYRIGHRHLQGCYADKDSLHSTIRILETVGP